MNNKKKERIDSITLLVKAYYDAFDFLHKESLKVLTDKALDKYLDTDLTVDEINDELANVIVKRQKELKKYNDDDSIKKNHEKTYNKLEEFGKN